MSGIGKIFGAGRAAGRPWRELVGVDLGEASVKVAHLVQRGGRVRRIAAAREVLPPASPAGSKTADRREAVSRTLREVVARIGLTGKPAAICVLGNEVLVRRLTLPPMSRADIHSALLLECRKLVGFPIEESELRYEIVGRARTDGNPELEILVTAARRRHVQEQRELLEEAGLKPAAVTIVPVALQSFLGAAGAIDSEEVVAYLDMGAATTHILVLKGREIRFSREFGVGGGTLTDALRSIIVRGRGTVELTAEEAEALKREEGIPLAAAESDMAAGVPLAAVSIMLRPILERLVRELWNSFDYCNEQYLGEAVTSVVLLGEGSRVRNLPEYLTGVLKIPVVRADLKERVVSVAGAEAGGASAASELALGLASLPRHAVNFLTPAGAGIPYRLAEAVPHQAAAAAAALLVLSVALPAHVGVVSERGRLAAARVELAALEPRADALRRFRAAREEETRLHDLLARLSGGQVLWSFVLRDLSHRVGEDVRLTALEVEEAPAPPQGSPPAARSMRLSGILRTDHRRSEEVLAELMQSLQRSPVLDQVRLEGCEAVDASRSSFVVSAKLAE